MIAVIIAGGLSTRLRPLTDNVPKPMLEIAGKNILERTLEQLKKAGVVDIILNTHYLADKISDYFGDGQKFGVKIEYFYEEDLVGIAGAVKKLEEKLKEPFLVIYGDNVFNLDFGKILSVALDSQSPALVALFDRKINPNSGAAGGVVEINGAGFVKGFWEGGARPAPRPDINFVNASIYILKPDIFKYIPAGVFCDFGKHVFPDLLKKGIPIQAYIISPDEAVFGADTLEYLEKTREYFSAVSAL